MSSLDTRKRAEELVVKLASGRKLGEVLTEMKITMRRAQWILRCKSGQKALGEARGLRALQRELTTGKGADKAAEEEALQVGELPAGVTEEEVRAAMRAAGEEGSR